MIPPRYCNKYLIGYDGPNEFQPTKVLFLAHGPKGGNGIKGLKPEKWNKNLVMIGPLVHPIHIPQNSFIQKGWATCV